ncbi:MAG: hypothetical protein KR126chlam5_00092 [Candidatus Anoxychlamydiales bacterium]|nr:hypothetical protein [Candidatus Anoxychlamydiales bacterium]
MTRFIGRKRELESLHSVLKKQSSSLIVIRGRRRIGKSRLIAEFGLRMRTVFFAGLPPSPETTDKSQREEFARQMQRELQIPLPRSDDWGDLFWILENSVKKDRVIIVFDEISWIGSKDPDFLGKLKNAWDLRFSKNPKLLLILCGSVSSWIEKNILSNTGFVGRISLDLIIREMPLSDCLKFWKDQERNIAPYEVFKALAVTGGVPRYLEEIISTQTAEENIHRLCFRREGLLFNEFDRIFNDLFAKRNEIYSKILKLLAEKPATLSEIYTVLEVQPSGACLNYMNDLIQAGFVTRNHLWSIKTGSTSNLSYFRVSDNYIRFYLKMIFPNKKQISESLFQKRSVTTLPNWSSIMGLQFENLVLNNFLSLCNKLNIPLEEVQQNGPFFQKKTKVQQGCQIDLMIQTYYNCIYICEIKFSKNHISSSTIEEVKEKIKRLTIPKGYSIKPVLIHVNGVSPKIKEDRFFAHVIDFSELFKS